MEINESTLKPKTTGGLKIMTIFIVVLAAHVLAIGGVTTYYMLKGSSDPDLVSDKTAPKTVKVVSDGATVSDTQALPGSDADKSDAMAATATQPTTGDSNDNNYTVPSAPADTAINTSATTPDNATAPVPTGDAMTIAPPGTTTVTEPTAAAPSAPIQTGPVITPPSTTAPGSAPMSETAAEPATGSTAILSQEPAEGITYTVKSHDSLARIAHHHHLTVAKLKAANNLKSDMLHIGQKLTIPGPAAAPESASALTAIHDPGTAVYGDTSATVTPAMTTPAALAATPAAATAAPAPAADTTTAPAVAAAKPAAKPAHEHTSLAATTGSHHLYTVMKGDTLTRIAHKFRTTTSAIMAANDTVDARKLRIGQKLRIPSQESRSANLTPVAQPEPAQPEPIEPRAAPRAQLANFLP